jgi:cyclase
MNHTLIVARMEGSDAAKVADLFAESDAGELPQRIGVAARTLFRFHGLYFHLIESQEQVRDRVERVRGDAEFQRLSAQLGTFIQPYDPDTWQTPSDAMATPFYHWRNHSTG